MAESRTLRWRPWAFYALVALAITAPLWRSGYILTLDLVFTPKLAAPTVMSNGYLWQWLLHLLNFVLPSQLIEKLVIFATLFVGGLGMHRLAQSVWESVGERAALVAYFAGLFYVINPWTYERWMAGHLLILAADALMPWFYGCWLALLAAPDRRRLIRATLLATVIAILSLHVAVMVALLAAVTTVGRVIESRKYKAKSGQPTKLYTFNFKLITYVAILTLGVVVLSSYWLIGLVSGHSAAAREIAGFNRQQLEAFATTGQSHLGLLVNVLGGYGFWLERFRRYLRPNELTPIFLLGVVTIGSLVAIGLVRLWRAERWLAVSLTIAAAVSFVLAAGIHAPLTGGAVAWALLHLPGLRGFREPEKFGGLLIFVYAILGGMGVQSVGYRVKGLGLDHRQPTLNWAALTLLLPLIYVPTMLWGFGGQLRPVQYPTSWYGFNAYLTAHPGDYRVLFLPWHQYMSYDFEPRIIASPAPGFFGPKVIAGDDAEFGQIFTTSQSPTSAAVVRDLETAANGQLASELTVLHVRYVALATGYDAVSYGFLDHQPGLVRLSSAPGLMVWRNERYQGSGS